MSTLNDAIGPNANQWYDVYALLAAQGVSVGDGLLIFNKGVGTVVLWEGDTDPGSLVSDGVPVWAASDPVIVDPGAAGLWARGISSSIRLNAQVLP